jgi:hypothetical protein
MSTTYADLPHARVLGATGGGGRPPIPTRDQILGIKTSGMQGMTVTMTQPGGARPVAFTDGLLTSPIFTKADRQAAYAEKRRLGDTHVILNISWNYLEPQLTYDVPGRDLAYDLPTFRQYVEEALDEGFYVLVMLAGDGDSKKQPDGSWDYSDPVGWTYGRDWLMENFQRVYDALKDLAPWIIWCPGYDGVVPHWQPPSSVDKWNQRARSIIGNTGYLNLHLSAGYCVWGDDSGETEGNNYPTPGGQAIDCITTCMPVPMHPPQIAPPPNFTSLSDEERKPWDQVWQIEGRLIQGYKRPPDQPADDDPHPPYLLAGGTPRGPFFHNVLEIVTYYWVRGFISLADTNIKREYLRAMNAKWVG